MGYFLKDHDIYVGSLQEKLNLRFAPTLGPKEQYGGLKEMVALQSEFEIFKEGRPFERSIAVLNLTGLSNHDTKNRFYSYLKSLRKAKSNIPGQNGDVAIVKAIVRNLASKTPLPVYFELHDLNKGEDNNRVIITDKARPLFYMKKDYLVISLPLGLKPTSKK
jgi:hypothetical protein